jgi:predicted MPP superfamily phosphohydrolase
MLEPEPEIVPTSRRAWLRRAAAATCAAVGAGAAYPLLEAKWCGIRRLRLAVPDLPPAFHGRTLVFLADLHHGPFTPLSYIRRVVAQVNAIRPDLIALGGDYVSGRPYIAPCIAELAGLRARWGTVAVLGNHDHWNGTSRCRAALDAAGITRLDNTGVWIEHAGDRLRIGGVGDLWTDRQDLAAALGSAREGDAVIVLSHNPDFVEEIDDPRVGLVLSGHTHGGQVVLPGFEVHWAPTRFGAKYLRGLCQGPVAPVFVTSGVGTTGPPVRLFCPPEIVAITLAPGPV